MATSRTGTATWKRVRKTAIARAIREGQEHCPTCGTLLDLHGTGDGAPVEVDHVIPWSRGGSDHVDNTAVLCMPCNRRKGAGPRPGGPQIIRATPPTHVDW